MKSNLQVMQQSSNSVCKFYTPEGVRLLKRLRLALSHLRDHKFKLKFQDSVNPIYKCG